MIYAKESSCWLFVRVLLEFLLFRVKHCLLFMCLLQVFFLYFCNNIKHHLFLFGRSWILRIHAHALLWPHCIQRLLGWFGSRHKYICCNIHSLISLLCLKIFIYIKFLKLSSIYFTAWTEQKMYSYDKLFLVMTT